jgi:fucose 4-O-acetylase-like acetyltransferase
MGDPIQEQTSSTRPFDGSKRLDWVDAARAVGMVLIYCGHWSPEDGRLRAFAYAFHLQFFFFASGIFYSRNAGTPLREYAIRLARRILVPFFFFGLLNIVVFSLAGDLPPDRAFQELGNLARGCTKSLTAGQLWFLTSLFCVQLVHDLLGRLFRRPLVTLGIALAAFFAVQAVPHIPPLYYNLHTVPQYLLFFTAGDVFHRYAMQRDWMKGWLFPAYGVSLLLAFLAFAKGVWFWGFPSPSSWLALAGWRLLMLVPLFIATVAVAKALTWSTIILDIGRNTLILFAVEEIVKKILIQTASLVSTPLVLHTSLQVLIFSLIAILVARRLFFRALNEALPWAVGKPMPIPRRRALEPLEPRASGP